MSSLLGTTLRTTAPNPSTVPSNAVCLFSSAGSEARSRLGIWDDRLARLPSTCREVIHQAADQVTVRTPSGDRIIDLKDAIALRELCKDYSIGYLDVSGLGHHVWAPVLRVALTTFKLLWVVYAEPDRYRPHLSSASATMFDLTIKIGGVAPLPGFTKLKDPPPGTRTLFVPLLGFEGTRARQVATSLDPVPEVVPIVGVPGFRIDYPFTTIACNQEFLDEYEAHANVRPARASCPFEAYRALELIQGDHPGSYMHVVPIGTKPHAVGAVWYAIDHPDHTELMYDHPDKRPQRTQGIGVVHFYCLRDER